MKMKKRLFSLSAVICAAALCMALFAACGGEEQPGGPSGEETPDTYTIAVTSSEDYALTPSKTSAKAGEEITVTAESKNADKYIEGVTFNGTACDEEDEGYSFTMPAANVTLAAEMGNYVEKLSDDFLSFTSFIPDTIAVYANTSNAEDRLYVAFSESVNVGIEGTESVQITSSNQNVIPDSALDCYIEQDGTFAESAIIYIAVNDIKPGKTYISMTVQDTTVSSKHATIVKALNVVDQDELDVPAMSVEFTFDLSKVADVSDEIIIGISDNYNKIYGSDMSLEKTVVVADEADLSEITFVMNNFAIGHKYSVTVSYLKDENRYALLNFDSEWDTSESTFGNSFLTVALGTESVGPFKVVK